jgi:hypothetical protein
MPVDYVLYKLNETLQVKDISNELVIARDINEAINIKSKLDFDIIPIKVNGKITTYYDSKLNSEKKIEPQEVISESTGILETLSYLSRRDFYFVISGNDITHIVHYSDLNSPLVSLGIYAQIAYCELSLRNFARSRNASNSDYGEKFLKNINKISKHSGLEINVERAKKQFRDKQSLQIETDLFDELYFDDELILFREQIKSKLDASEIEKFAEFINLEDSRIKLLKDMRNEVMHSKPEIIKKQSDIDEWLKLLQYCQNIINVLSGKTVFYK